MWIKFLVSLIQILLPALLKAATPTAEDGEGPGELEAKLRSRLAREGWE